MKHISNSRALAVLLVLALCLGMIPAAWAEEPAALETPGVEPAEAVQENVSNAGSQPGETVLLHGDEVVTAADGLRIADGTLFYEAEHFSPFIVLAPNGDVSNAEAHSGTRGNLNWTLSADGTLTISGSGEMIDFSYDSSEAWTQYSDSIKKVVIQSGVTSIGTHAFDECSSLTSVTMPKSLKSIGGYAFARCSSLTSVTIPTSVTSIGKSAFYRCSSLTSITIPSGLTSIGDFAFEGCGMTGVTIPEGVTSIGRGVFSGCSKLASVTLPASLTSLDSTAGWLESTTLLKTAGPIGSGCDIEFAWTDEIPAYAFYKSGLTSVILPQGLSVIGASAFDECDLTSLNIPSSVILIDNYAFYGCNMTSLKIPSSVKSVRKAAFGHCYELEDAKLSSGMTSIDTSLFDYCTALRTVTIPSSVTNISPAFDNCTGLKYVYYQGTESQWNNITIGTNYYLTSAILVCKPEITTQPKSATVKEGGNATFKVVASGTGLSYQWQWRAGSSGTWTNVTASDITGVKTTTLSVPATTARNGYQYRCKVTNSAGTVYSSAAALTVGSATAKPAITAQPKSATAAADSTATFKVTATGGALSYQWQYYTGSKWADVTNSSYTGLKTATMTVPATSARNGTKYRCRVSNSGGTVYSDAATLTVVSAPKITVQPKSATAAAGSTATFKVTATGGALSYQWQFSSGGEWANITNSAYTGVKSATMTVPATTSRNGYKFRCRVTNSAGTVYSNAATLTVNVITEKPTIAAQTLSVTVTAGGRAYFDVRVGGTGLSYEWQYNSGSGWAKVTSSAYTGLSTSTMSVTASAARNGYQYRCKVTNNAGTVYTQAMTLTVR